MNWKSIVPEAKHETVEKALLQTFGATEVEEIQLLTGGLSSALVYRIVVGERCYVLRLVMRVDELTDPVRQYACMNAAAEAGIAPHVYYADIETAASITDFIATIPRQGAFLDKKVLLRKLVETVQGIHSLPLFPKLVNFMDGVDGFIQGFHASRLLPESATEEHFRYYAEIQRVYPRHDPDVVSSHNDLNPNNILWDGTRLWIVDWEVAFQNDRYADLANVANYFVTNDEEEAFYLTGYFGDSLDEYKRARFFLMQQVYSLFYAMGFFHLAAAQRKPESAHSDSMETPRRHEFHELLSAGLSLASYEGQLLYGKVLLNEALRKMKTPRFAEAIKTVTTVRL